MAAPATEEVRELERLLVIASDLGEARSFASLREELGIGHEDLEAALGVLREHGKAQELTPGEWSGPDGDALEPEHVAEADRVVVSVPESDSESDTRAPADAASQSPPGPGVLSWEPTVRLTMAIAQSLDAQALGALVKAGIDDAATRFGEVFVLEVLP